MSIQRSWPIIAFGLLAACRSSDPQPAPSVDATAADTTVAPDTTPPPADKPKGPNAPDEKEVTPIFPATLQVAPDPLAVRLCAALHEVPAKARAACCAGSSEAPELASECVRTLSIMLHDAAVSIDEAALSQCEAATQAAVAGCDWVTPLRAITVPACADVVRGRVVDGAKCKSSLACGAGSFCDGLGPTAQGECKKPFADGGACGPLTDVLADLTGQEPSLALTHPRCQGYCHSRRCVARSAIGAACSYRAACGPDARCLAGTCVAGASSALGEVCDQGSPCAAGSACHVADPVVDPVTGTPARKSGTCVALKKKGEACSRPFECEASCIVPSAGATGTCGPRCDASALPAPLPPK